MFSGPRAGMTASCKLVVMGCLETSRSELSSVLSILLKVSHGRMEMIEREILFSEISKRDNDDVDRVVLDALIKDGIIPSEFKWKLIAIYKENENE